MTQPSASLDVNIGHSLDSLIGQVQDTFHAFLLAQTTLQLGDGALNAVQDHTAIQATVGVSIGIEPIAIGELKQYRATFPDFLLEVFHGKMVQHWHACLQTLFCTYVEAHLAGHRPFVELKTQTVKIDFASASTVDSQANAALIRDFDFWEYSDRQKLIDKLRNPDNKHANALRSVHTHVQMRNAFQHRQGVVDAFMLRKLGVTTINLLDAQGSVTPFAEGDLIKLSIPELDVFRRSLLLVGQAWRGR